MSGRIVPLSGTDRARQVFDLAGKFLPNEIHSTNQRRVFIQNVLIGPVWHGVVADETAMRALDTTATTRGCFPGDWCKRTDTGSLWLCITNRGELLADWVEVSGGGGGGGVTIDTDGTLAADSDVVVASQKATKTYVDALASTLGTAATKNVGTTAGTVAAGDDARFASAASAGNLLYLFNNFH